MLNPYPDGTGASGLTKGFVCNDKNASGDFSEAFLAEVMHLFMPGMSDRKGKL